MSVSLSDFKVVIVYLKYKNTKITYNKIIKNILVGRVQWECDRKEKKISIIRT